MDRDVSRQLGAVKASAHMCRAIPTNYNGVEFRSRLEASTAALLDKFAIAWRYEAISFLLPDGSHYWPDFELPALHTWLECRGYDGRDEQLDAWSARCAQERERFVVVRGNGLATIASEWDLCDDAGLRFCHGCRAWCFDALYETRECSACGHVRLADEIAVALPVGATEGRPHFGAGYDVDRILSAIAARDDMALLGAAVPSAIERMRALWRCAARDTERGVPFDMDAMFEWFDECKAARVAGKPTPPSPAVDPKGEV